MQWQGISGSAGPGLMLSMLNKNSADYNSNRAAEAGFLTVIKAKSNEAKLSQLITELAQKLIRSSKH